MLPRRPRVSPWSSSCFVQYVLERGILRLFLFDSLLTIYYAALCNAFERVGLVKTRNEGTREKGGSV